MPAPTRLRTAVVVLAVALLGAALAAPARAATGGRAACATPVAGQARCFAVYSATDAAVRGIGPAQVADAYALPVARGKGRTVAIVDAYDDPRAEADLATYRAHFGLPPCTTANGCFRKVNGRGRVAPLPHGDPGWGVEISLDLDAVSAACPQCSILLVEGDSPTLGALGTAVDTAVRLGADVVSNSYGLQEFGGMSAYAPHYRHPGVPVLASSGDDGFTAASFPAVVGSVVAVGGTSLRRTATGWQERAWSGGGSGCSAYVQRPAWQPAGHCPMRLTADVSAVADPRTGLAVRDTYGLGKDNGWLVVGGTSASSPLVAGMVALSAHPADLDSPSRLYGARGGFTDVVGGSNGYCGGDYLCTALPGYDGPTGVGSPHGVSGL